MGINFKGGGGGDNSGGVEWGWMGVGGGGEGHWLWSKGRFGHWVSVEGLVVLVGADLRWDTLFVAALARSGLRYGLWGARGVLWAVSKFEILVRAPSLPRFILLVSFSDTLLVVSILDMILVYDCHLCPLLQS